MTTIEQDHQDHADHEWPRRHRRRRLSYALVLTPLLLGNALMLGLSLLGFYVLSATRAYVGGESLWSQGRVEAIRQLRQYAGSGRPESLARFQASLAVPLGDRQARLAMDEPRLDRERATEGLLRGGNAPEDTAGMIRLYRWFGDTELMRPSIEAWREGDVEIARLQAIAARLQQHYRQPQATNGQPISDQLALIDALESRLQALERRFGEALGDGSRAVFLIMSVVVALTALLLTLTAYGLARRGLLRQAQDESRLADANKRWALAAESDGLGVFEWEQRDDHMQLDARACSIYGLASGPAGRRIARSALRLLIAPEEREAVAAAFDEAVRSAPLYRRRYRVLIDGKASRCVEISGLLLGEPGSGARRIVGMVKDVSDQVRQELLTLEKTAAERSASARMEFLSRLSHELRTPLNAVLGFSDLLLLDGSEPLTARQRERIELIGSAGRHLLRLVDDVLDISGIDGGKYQVERVPTRLAPLLSETLGMVAAEARQFEVELIAEPLAGDISVLGDAQRLGQVLLNLLSNACKYNRPGGQVRLSVRQQAQQVLIEVADQGAGLSEQDLRQLFQPFKRLAATAHLPGTGLGLTIVKLLVEQMGGSIRVRSQPGSGSVFTITLQATQPQAAELADQAG
ncbi:MAG: ATP-binding protein [Burkholderiaceae bacterium]